MCGARYGAAEAVQLTEGWLGVVRRAAYLASTELAREKGAFPLFDRDAYLAGEAPKAWTPRCARRLPNMASAMPC